MTLQTRRQGLSPLAIVLPHPALPIPPRRTKSRSSLLSISAASSLSLSLSNSNCGVELEPHTPRSCRSSPLSINMSGIYYPANRKSSDSWNSSSADDHEEMEVEWTPEEVLLLSRTLDALPSHLLTPFNGPIPPSNLLDKIARGVSQAKGPLDWPHSVRSTRVKLLELAKGRAKEERGRVNRALVIEEGDEMAVDLDVVYDGKKKKEMTVVQTPASPSPVRNVTSRPPRAPRPLYRQSSMDFIKPGPAEDINIRGNKAIASLANRLQRSDRLSPHKAYQYHPYMRPISASTSTANARSPLRALSHLNPPTNTASASSRPSSTSSCSSDSSSPHILSDVPSLVTSASSSPYSTLTATSLSTLETVSVSSRRRAALVAAFDMDPDVGNGMGGIEMTVKEKEAKEEVLAAPVHPQQKQPMTRPIRIGLKRAPDYGASRQEVKIMRETEVEVEVNGNHNGNKHVRNVSYPSSDEEEKVRSKRVKKMRVRGGNEVDTPATAAATSAVQKLGLKDESENIVSKTRESPTPSPSIPPVPPTKTKTKTKTRDKTSMDSTDTSLSSRPRTKAQVPVKPSSRTEKNLENSNPLKTSKPSKPSKTKPLPMNLQRNPSMFGEELPPLVDRAGVVESFGHSSATPAVGPPVPPKDVIKKASSSVAVGAKKSRSSPKPASSTSTVGLPMLTTTGPSPSPSPSPTTTTAPTSPTTLTAAGAPSSPVVRTLRRVPVRRLVPSRRISFGSIAGPAEPGPEMARAGGELERLGSAIQLA